MPGILFNYFPGRLDAHFRHGEFDEIVLRLRMRGAGEIATSCDDQFHPRKSMTFRQPRRTFSVYMTSVFCPFTDFIRFLEAVTLQVQECAFEWDPEGPEARMSWSRRHADRDGFLTVSWSGHHAGHAQKFSHRMLLNTRQTVGMLYTAFRRFVESDNYDPFRYEDLQAREAFGLLLADTTLDGLASLLADLEGERAERLLRALRDTACARRLGESTPRYSLAQLHDLARTTDTHYDNEPLWIPPEWRSWDRAQRLRDIHENTFAAGLGLADSVNLRTLRSPLIEQWLAAPAARNVNAPGWRNNGQ